MIILKVQEVLIQERKRYLLIDKSGYPVIPVAKYIKHLDNIGKAENTLKSYCYHLKLYFQFLEECGLSYQEVNLDILARFIGWLRIPDQSTKVIYFEETLAKRSEKTVNTIITCVIGFYEYMARNEDYGKNISDQLKKQVPGRFKTFKPFLHHITKDNSFGKNILKIKEPRRTVKTLSKNQLQVIRNACSNIRDELLFRILYEGGLRIGEALSLWVEDFDIGKNAITVRKSKTSDGEKRKVYASNETMNLFQDYLIDYHSYEIDSNYVFITLTGTNRGKPMTDSSVRSLIKRMKKKTGIDFTPHMLRHTYATELHEAGVDIAIIQRLLGHAHVQTTIQTYIHASDETIRGSWEQAQSNNKMGRRDK